MTSQVRAVVWAQQRAIRHNLRRGLRAGSILAGLLLLVWYAGWLGLAVLAGTLTRRPDGVRYLETFFPQALFFVVLYWQLTPVLLGSQGASLDLRKLLAFPIPTGHLFGLEMLLRTSTCLEVLAVLGGAGIGLALNPALSNHIAPSWLAGFVLFNLFLGAGLKYQLDRWLRRRRLRELLMLLVVMSAALPQLLLTIGAPAQLRGAAGVLRGWWWPWSVAARLALGSPSAADWGLGIAWMLLAYWYGRTQFWQHLRLEAQPEAAPQRTAGGRVSWREKIYRLPSRVLPDPLAALVEKEIRSLVRSPRFRLLFVMGFSFGILIFLPMLLSSRAGGEMPSYRLTMVCGYALLLLSDVIFWNIFGADRAAAQLYFSQPASMLLVVVGKNLAAGLFVLLEITGVIFVWALLRMPLSTGRVAEAYLAPAVVSVYMMAMGNLASVYYPRPLSAEKTSGAGSAPAVRILLILLLPVLSLPVLAAYFVRYVLASEMVFFPMLALAALVGVSLYRLALEVTVKKADQRKEKLLEALSAGEGPIQLG